MQSHRSRQSHGRRGRTLGLVSTSVLLGTVLTTLLAPGIATAVGPTLPPRGASPVTTQPSAAAAPKTTVKKAAQSSSKTTAKKPTAKTASAKKASSKASVSGLGLGSRGAAVQAVQERLIELKYDISEAEGQFGDQTYHAVMAFQKANGLSRTGRVGSQMLAALQTATDLEPMLPAGGAKRVEVDLKRQILMIWDNNELYRVISISSGNNQDFCSYDPETEETSCDKAVTPTGSYRIQRRWVGWRESRLGEMYNPLYFTGGFAIHGSTSVPGTPASHGCVRVPMVTAEWLPGVLENGVPIYVFGAKDTDKKPTALKSVAATTRPGGTTVPGSPTIPGASTVPGQTVPATAAATTSTSTTTTIVRLLNGGSAPETAPATAPPAPIAPAPTTQAPTTVPPSSLLPIG